MPGASRSATSPTAATKLIPPAPPAAVLSRARLLERLDTARHRRLTAVLGDAGFGKSTLLASWAAENNCAWYGADAEDASLSVFARGLADALWLRVPSLPADLAAALVSASDAGRAAASQAHARGFAAILCEALQAGLTRDLTLVVDDAHELDRSPASLALLESLCRQAPPLLHVLISSRAELPFPVERLRGRGQFLELAGTELAFDVEEVADLLALVCGDDDPALATAVYEATDGWPAAVRLAVEALARVERGERAGAIARLHRPGGPVFAYLAGEIFAHEPSGVRELVDLVAPLERFTPELCAFLGVPRAAETLTSLSRRGLFVELRGASAGWFTLGTPVREFALARLDATAIRDARRAAARWFATHGSPQDALRCMVAADDAEQLGALLADHGEQLVSQGWVDLVAQSIAVLAGERRGPALERLAGEVAWVRGDWDESLRCYERALDGSRPPPGLAWRMGVLHQLRGRLDEALAAYDGAAADGPLVDRALLHAWRAAAQWLRGDVEACRADAEIAFALASAAESSQALAASHTVLAMLAAFEGDRGANAAHYLRALDHAQRAGDVLQTIRIRTNRGSRHLEEGSYQEAIAELDQALRLADLAGFTVFRALALTNRGEARARLGQYEEAVSDLEEARDLYDRLGSRMVAYPLGKLGEIHRERGHRALAQAAYERALVESDASGDLQGLVPALAGLARVVAADDPEEAGRLVERALALPAGIAHAQALLAAAWVALARGDRMKAAERAQEAAAVAGPRRDRAALAEALEVRALATGDRREAVAWLDEASSLWRELGNPLGRTRAELLRALRTGQRDVAETREARLRELGLRGYLDAVSALEPTAAGPPAIQTLGRFQVLLDGRAVPVTAWRSRKARDLLKLLVVRRGRPVAREALMEALWPDQSPGPLGNRLSVLQSTVRSVLDPERRQDADHFLGADKSALWLRVEHLDVDVERFLARAEAALDLHRVGGREEAQAALAEAESLYGGDFLEEDVYEDWAVDLREEARSVYTEVARVLADAAVARGDVELATRYFLRVLERDRYDEPAHLGLVAALEAAGRHGEARRRYRAYCARMDELGLESAPFPSTLRQR